MNSCCNENLIIFAMALVSTCSDSWIKIRVLGPPRVNSGSNLVKVAKNSKELEFDIKP